MLLGVMLLAFEAAAKQAIREGLRDLSLTPRIPAPLPRSSPNN
jgi:hypothetical protein